MIYLETYVFSREEGEGKKNRVHGDHLWRKMMRSTSENRDNFTIDPRTIDLETNYHGNSVGKLSGGSRLTGVECKK